ncbi:MAG: hypothetical protein Q9181_002389 [Wetmoreana brouardii]
MAQAIDMLPDIQDAACDRPYASSLDQKYPTKVLKRTRDESVTDSSSGTRGSTSTSSCNETQEDSLELNSDERIFRNAMLTSEHPTKPGPPHDSGNKAAQAARNHQDLEDKFETEDGKKPDADVKKATDNGWPYSLEE